MESQRQKLEAEQALNQPSSSSHPQPPADRVSRNTVQGGLGHCFLGQAQAWICCPCSHQERQRLHGKS